MNFKEWMIGESFDKKDLLWLTKLQPAHLSDWENDIPFTYSAEYDELFLGEYRKFHADITQNLKKTDPAKARNSFEVREGLAPGTSGRVAWKPVNNFNAEFVAKMKLKIPSYNVKPQPDRQIPNNEAAVLFYDRDSPGRLFKPEYAVRSVYFLLQRKVILPTSIVVFKKQIYTASDLV